MARRVCKISAHLWQARGTGHRLKCVVIDLQLELDFCWYQLRVSDCFSGPLGDHSVQAASTVLVCDVFLCHIFSLYRSVRSSWEETLLPVLVCRPKTDKRDCNSRVVNSSPVGIRCVLLFWDLCLKKVWGLRQTLTLRYSIIHPKIPILSWFAHPYVITHVWDFLFSVEYILIEIK